MASGHTIARHAMEDILHRSLGRYEVVHHKDGDSDNNTRANLQLMTLGEHSKFHVDPLFGCESTEVKRQRALKYSTWTREHTRYVFLLRAYHWKLKEIAAMFGVSRKLIVRIVSGKHWSVL